MRQIKDTGTELQNYRVALAPVGVSAGLHCIIAVPGGGGRKNHMKVLSLCWEHHLGAEGIDGKRMSKRDWQTKYGSETDLLAWVDSMLNR